jgi:hypothetical protein
MRFLIVLVLGWMATTAHAQSYLEKKDADAIGVIERSLAKIDKVPSMFDGTSIPPGADLQAVQGLYDQLSTNLKAARGAFNDLTSKRAAMADARTWRARFDELERYTNALGPVLSRAKTDAEHAARKQRDDNQREVQAAAKVCGEFREELRKNGRDSISSDYQRLGALTEIADGHPVFWQNAEDGAKYKGTIERTQALCKRIPTAGASCKRASNVEPADARFCETAAKGIELMKMGVKNLIAHHVKHSGPTDVIKDFDRYKGYVDVDGVVSWKDYFSGAKTREVLSKRILPMLPQAELTEADADVLFAGLATEFAQLEEKAREAAPTWELPGAPCSGPGCAQAKKFFQQWYRGSAIKRFQHTQPGWKILTNGLGIPTYRERYGYALVQVKGDPFCQLRLWTYSEPYAGGGRYTAGRDVHLHSVRWQTCK